MATWGRNHRKGFPYPKKRVHGGLFFWYSLYLMNIPNSKHDDFAEEMLPLCPPGEPPDARVIPIKPEPASVRARALQIIDEYDGLLQRLVEIVGRSP